MDYAALLLAETASMDLIDAVTILRDVGVVGCCVAGLWLMYTGRVYTDKVVPRFRYDLMREERDARVPRDLYDAILSERDAANAALRKKDDLLESRIIPALVESNRLIERATRG